MAGFYQKLLIRLPGRYGRKDDMIEEYRLMLANAAERAEALERENEALRARVAELEAQAARR